MSQLPTAAAAQGPSHLTIAFATDAHELIRLGILVDKGGTLGLGAGIGGGIAAAATGHWIIALIVGLVGFFVKAAADEYKETKFKEMQQKWHGVFAGLSAQQTKLFAEEVARYYPGIMYALTTQVLGTNMTQQLLSR